MASEDVEEVFGLMVSIAEDTSRVRQLHRLHLGGVPQSETYKCK